MRLSDFAEKYGISYTLVREASMDTVEIRDDNNWGCKDFAEESLLNAVRENIMQKLENARAAVRRNEERLAKLNKEV